MSDLELTFEFRNKRFQDATRGLRAFQKALKASWDGSAKVLSRELKEFLDAVALAMSRRHSTPYPAGTTALTLSKRSGSMIKSILESVKVEGETYETVRGVIGGSKVARTHEFGAVITPKRAKFLTVPLPAALNSDGTPKKMKARDWPNTFVARTKAGNLVIFQKAGMRIIPLYVLKTSVKIPPRLGMQQTLTTQLPYFVDRAMDAIIRDVRASLGAPST